MFTEYAIWCQYEEWKLVRFFIDEDEAISFAKAQREFCLAVRVVKIETVAVR